MDVQIKILFFATSAKDILNFFDVGIKANYAYAVMANQ